jgi:cephalosporin hydroxylase
MTKFKKEVADRIKLNAGNSALVKTAKNFMILSAQSKYSYNYSALGRPIIQHPEDMIAIQELIWQIKPDLIIETGIAHGGSLIMSASMLSLLDTCDAIELDKKLNPKISSRKVLGIDIDIRKHNLDAIENHPMSSRIQMIQGSSIDPYIIKKVKKIAVKYQRVLVLLDSNHTHDHVLKELKAYAPLVSKGSYCIVYDTIIEDLPEDMFKDRPWGPGNNPKTAVYEYLKNYSDFEVDKTIQDKLLISVAPEGYLKKIR